MTHGMVDSFLIQTQALKEQRNDLAIRTCDMMVSMARWLVVSGVVVVRDVVDGMVRDVVDGMVRDVVVVPPSSVMG